MTHDVLRSTADHDARVSALILAGRRSGEIDPLASVENAPHKALLIAGGKPLLRRVAEALQTSKRVSEIRVAAPHDVRDAFTQALAGIDGWAFVDSEASPTATVLAAIERLQGEERLLVTTCDHALLNAAIVRDFLNAVGNSDAAAACVEKEAYRQRFPNSRRTFIRLKDLQFSGANLFYFNGARAKNLAAFWRRLEMKRKNPAAMAREIGVVTALSYLIGITTKAGLEKTIKRKTGVSVRLTPLDDPQAAIDVDKPEDLVLVREILALD